MPNDIGMARRCKGLNLIKRLTRRRYLRLVRAQHGHVVNEVEVPCRNTRTWKMKKLPSEANSEKGDLSGKGRLGERPKGREPA